jgi:hypothetical protein
MKSRSVFQVANLVFSTYERDGVGEGQFSQVLLYEMDAIRKVRRICSRFNYYYFNVSDNSCKEVSNFLPLLSSGLCISGTKLFATSYFYCSAEETPYSALCYKS